MSSKVRSESCIAGAEWRSGKPGPAKRDASRVALDKDDSVLRRHHDQRDAGDAVQRRSMAEDCPILRWVNDRPPDQGKHQGLICDEVRQRGWGGDPVLARAKVPVAAAAVTAMMTRRRLAVVVMNGEAPV